MLHNSFINNKIIIPIILVILIITTLSVSGIYIKYQNAKSLDTIKNGINISFNISLLIHELQKERGLSVGYISSNGTSFKPNLLKQIKDSDSKIKSFNLFIKDNNISYINTIKLKDIRNSILDLTINPNSVIKNYSKLINTLLAINIKHIKSTSYSHISNQMIAYNYFMEAKEQSGILRAIGMTILTSKKNHKSYLTEFKQHKLEQQLYIKQFLKYSSKENKNYFISTFSSDDIVKTTNMMNDILNEKINFSNTKWWKSSTNAIDLLKTIDDYFIKKISCNIDNESHNINSNLFIFAGLNIIALVIIIFITKYIMNLLLSQKRLKDTLDKRLISSTTNDKGIIIDASEAFCDISGYSKEELIGKSHNIVRHPDMPKSAFRDMWMTIQGKDTWHGEVKNLKKDGGYYWVDAYIQPILNTKGEIESYLSIRTDITANKDLAIETSKNEEQQLLLMHQSKLAQMGEMISMIAHQWRQPLGAINSTTIALQMSIEMGNSSDEKCLNKLDSISEYSKFLSKTIDDFRNFFKTNKKKEVTTLEKIVDKTLNIAQASIGTNDISITKEYDCHEEIETYASEVQQVLLNLIKNAEDAISENNTKDPQISIYTKKEQDNIYIFVKDNAGGIPEDIIPKIFDSYFSTKIDKEGTGLGLYMSKTIIEEHCGGKLSVQNENNGALFIIEFKI